MTTYNLKKETVLNPSKIRLLIHTESQLKNEHAGGWIDEIKLISHEDNIYSTAKVFLAYIKPIKVNGDMIGHIKYDYEISPNTDSGRVSYPTFEEGHFTLIEEEHTFFEKEIEELNNDNN